MKLKLSSIKPKKQGMHHNCLLSRSTVNSGSQRHDEAILDEYRFARKIEEERRRTDRSEKPFLLVLLDIHEAVGSDPGETIPSDILATLASSKRETDSCGWYDSDATIGIIYTEIAAIDTQEARNAIAAKIRRKLAESMPPEIMAKVSIYFHFYPEKYDDEQFDSTLFDDSLYPDLEHHGVARQKGYAIKRIIDIAGSSLALLIFSPLLLILSVLIAATSKGPVLFRQERIGQHVSKFTFLKFRSMYVDTDDTIHREYIKKLITENMPTEGKDADSGGPVYKITNDPRVTAVGRFLRKTSFDELPQLLNVFKGEMSLVGPRPAIPYEYESYAIWHRYRLLQMKPGITGLWQVTGRSSTSFDEMVRLDLQYIQHWSLRLDLKILWLTPWAVIKGKGAY